MTAKRFEAYGGGYFIDNVEDSDLGTKELLEIANVLHEENEQLQQKIKREIGHNQRLHSDNCELHKENKQLKKELQQYKDRHKKWIEKCEELHKDFEKDWKQWGRM